MEVKLSRAWDAELGKYKNILKEYNVSYFEEDGEHYAKIEINNLGELFLLAKKLDKDLIINNCRENSIIIYDDYME